MVQRRAARTSQGVLLVCMAGGGCTTAKPTPSLEGLSPSVIVRAELPYVVTVSGTHLAALSVSLNSRGGPVRDQPIVYLGGLEVPILAGASETLLRVEAPAALGPGPNELKLVFSDGTELMDPDALTVMDNVAMGGTGGTGGTGSAAGVDAGVDAGSDWTEGFLYRRLLTLDNTGPEDWNDLAVAVHLAPDFIDPAKYSAGGADLRFVEAETGAPLAHEVERLSAGQRGLLWVRLPRVAAGQLGYSVWMYYGNGSAVDAQAPTAVWSDGYDGVWHLAANGRDSSVSAAHALVTTATASDSDLGQGFAFDGAERVDLGSPVSLADVFVGGGTLSAWFVAEGWGSGDLGRVVDKAMGLNSENGWSLELKGAYEPPVETLRFEHGFSGATGSWGAPAGSVALGQPYYVAVSFDSSNLGQGPDLYLNGVRQVLSEDQTPSGSPLPDALTPLWIGDHSQQPGLRGFEGRLDEVRIARTQRSEAWMLADYLSVSDQLWRYGIEEVRP